MVIFGAKLADNLLFKMFLVVFCMLKVGSHLAVNGYEI
jgi:hypothetical protein